jgi:hypothetical protein
MPSSTITDFPHPVDRTRTNRHAIVVAMAKAAWVASGERTPWEKLPPIVRREWTSFQECAFLELERQIPLVSALVTT